MSSVYSCFEFAACWEFHIDCLFYGEVLWEQEPGMFISLFIYTVYPLQLSKEKYVANIMTTGHGNVSSVWIAGPPQSKKYHSKLPIPITITAQVGPSRISMPNMCKMKFDDITRLSDDRYYIFKQSWIYKLNKYHNAVRNETIFYVIKLWHSTLFTEELRSFQWPKMMSETERFS